MKKVSSSSSLSSSSTDLSKPVNKPKTKRIRRNIETEKPHFGGGPGRRSSIYRGVTRHRWTGRYEAHLWDKNSWNPVQNKKGRQVYLGAYDDEEAAAHTYDLAALKYWGSDTILNFPLATYAKEYEAMQTVSKEEYLATLRRRSSGFSRGVSKYRGVARHHHNGRWEARIGRVFGNKYLYLGTYSTQEEAAAAYDMAAIEYRGLNAVTNFDISRYFNINQQPKPYHPQSHHHYTAGLGTFVDRTEVREPFNEHNHHHHHQHYLVQDISNSIVDEPPMLTDEPSVASDIVDHPWSVCMAPIFNTIPDSDISSHAGSGELQDLFGDVGFEENIDFLFDGAEVVVESCEQKTGTQVHVNAILENSDNFGGEFLNEVEQDGEHGLTLGDTLSAYTCPISICT